MPSRLSTQLEMKTMDRNISRDFRSSVGDLILQGIMQNSARFRVVLWRRFDAEIENICLSDVINSIQNQRNEYDVLAGKYEKFLGSKTKDYVENLYTDINRTFSNHSFIGSTEGQQLLLKLLVLWDEEHPDLTYHQGMSEILAGVIIAIRDEYKIFITRKDNDDKEYVF